MKLHLPKALFTAVIAAFAVSQTAWADTYNLLASGDNWSFEGRGPIATYSNGVVTSSAQQWKQSLSTYTLGNSRQYYDVGADGTLSFTFTYNQTQGEGNSVLNVALVGREQVLAFGSFEYADAVSEGGGNSLGWGTSTATTKEVYHNGTLWDASTVGTVNYNRFSANGVDATRTTGLYTYTGTVVKNDEGNYLLDLSVTVGEGESATTIQYLDDVNLGASFDIQRVAFGVDGASSVPLSTLSITGALVDPSTYVTSVAAGSTNASSASWTVDGQGVNYGDIALTDGSVVLDISGAAEGSTVVLDAGTKVSAIDVSMGSVTLQSSGSITAQELVAKDGASVTIGSDLKASSVAGAVSVASGATLTMQEGAIHTITGAGNITLTGDASISSAAQATGKLTVQGATLTVEPSGGNPQMQENSLLTSFTSIDLDGATVRYHGSTTEWKNVTVTSNGATLKIKDMTSNDLNANKVLKLTGTTTLNGNLTIESAWQDSAQTWKYGVNIAALTGAGDLTIKGTLSGGSNDEKNHVTAKLLGTYGGKIRVEQSSNNSSVTIFNATADGDINLKGLEVVDGSTVNLSGVAGVKNLGVVDIDARSSLDLADQIGNMQSSGAGAIKLASGADFSGTASIANNVEFGGTVTNSGNLTLTGTLTATTLDSFDDASGTAPVYDGGDVSGNGFLNSTFYVVKSTGATSQLDVSNLSMSVGGISYTLQNQNGNLLLVTGGSGGVYYVNENQDYTAESAIAAAGVSNIILNGGTLTMKSALANGVSISAQNAGGIHVAAGVTLDNSSVSASGGTKATLSGDSTAVFNLGTGLEIDDLTTVSLPNVTHGSDWKGITTITNSRIGKNTLDQLSGGSTLKLVGLHGWLVRAQTVNSDLVLENYSTDGGTTVAKSAFVFNDSSQDSYTFAGSISGSGDFQFASTSEYWAKVFFTGSTEDWTGGIKITNSYDGQADTSELYINLTSGGDIFSAEGNKGIVMDRASNSNNSEQANIVNLTIGSTSADSTMNGAISMGDDERAQLNLTVQGNTTFKKDVEVTSMTVNSEKTATIEAAATTGSLTTNGTVKVTGAGSLTYGGNTTVTAPAQSTFGTETTGATITADSITGGVVTFTGDTAATESRTISDSSIVNNGTAVAAVTVGAQNASVHAATGGISMTALTGSTTVGDLTVASGLEVSVQGGLTVTDTFTASSEGAVMVLNGALTLDGATVDLTGLTLAHDKQSYTLGWASSYSFAGVTIDLTEAQLTAAGFAADTQYELTSDADGWLVLALTPNTPAVKPTLTEVNVASGSWDDASKVLTLTTLEKLEDFSGLGTTLNAVIGDELWVQLTQDVGTLVDVSFVDAAGNVFDFDGVDGSTLVNVTLNGVGTNTVPTVYGNEGTVVGSYMTSYIPEPTSTTLSLLALAALAVRRRRK